MPAYPTREVRQFIQGAPVVHVSDIRATGEYYRDVLGFTFDFAAESYAVVWRENAAVHLMHGDGPRQGFHFFFWLHDVDAYYDEVVKLGATILAPPETQPYGLREFAAVDLNGIRLLFAMDVD